MSFGGDVRQFGEYTVGTPDEFVVYPDGRAGTEIHVAFEMQADMISGSDMARIFIAISDTDVVVTGLAIPDREQRFSR